MPVVTLKPQDNGFKVEKGVELPETRGRSTKYPWDQMDVGDSFFVSGVKISAMARAALAASKAGSRQGWKFSTRTVDGGVRVWRIA